ncbi:MAG: pantoate--beta-alanine ligase [Candidatus Nanopelagicales bacterium]|nr:pantoate--beta-alanine ligase [Candidatus Nanopelagicales bacterium]
MTVVVHTRKDYWALMEGAPDNEARGDRACVPTMGALHAGHMQLVTAARELVGPRGQVVVTIFVNPTQFGASEDLASYPRPFHEDVAQCVTAGVDIVFAPTVEEMYPGGARLDTMTSVHPGPVGEILEAVDRPGHFAGMLTVVAKLLNITQPQHAFFGEKDYQQLALITSMVADLNMPVTVHGVPTVRDADGVALSSRNTYLSESERVIAQSIPAALRAAQRTEGTVADKVQVAQAHLSAEIDVHYLEAMSNDLSARLDPPQVPVSGRLLFAGNVGSTRLIDNMDIGAGGTGDTA